MLLKSVGVYIFVNQFSKNFALHFKAWSVWFLRYTEISQICLTFLSGLDDYKSDREEAKSDTESSHSEEEEDQVFDKLEHSKPAETPYTENRVEELGQVKHFSSSIRQSMNFILLISKLLIFISRIIHYFFYNLHFYVQFKIDAQLIWA